MAKTHFIIDSDGEYDDYTACGKELYSDIETSEYTEDIDCAACMKTSVFKEASGMAPKSKPEIDFEITDDVKKAFLFLGNMLRENRNVQNYCHQYDEIIKSVNRTLPDGMVIPGRLMEFKVAVKFQGQTLVFPQEAKNAKEAIELVQRNFRYGPMAKAKYEIVKEEVTT